MVRTGHRQALDDAELLELLQRLPDIVYRYRLRPDPAFEYVSPSVLAITGYSAEEHYADPYLGLRIVHPDDRPILEALMREPRDDLTYRTRWLHRNGRVFCTEHRLTLLRDEQGEVYAVEGVARPVEDDVVVERTVSGGDVILDLLAQRAEVDGRVVDLTPSEHRILALLLAADRPVSRREIVERLWGRDLPGGERVAEVHVSNLRRKLERDPRRPERIVTVRGVGYRFMRE